MSVNRPEIWIVRHGETEWSVSGQHTGRTDLVVCQNSADRDPK
jgi:probable phosphoglycerate mutase